MTERLPPAEAAAAGGVDIGYLERVTALGILRAAPDGGFTIGDVRRLTMLRSLEDAGLSLEGIAEALRRHIASLDFADSPSYARFAAFTRESFQEVSARTGVPLELLAVLREALGQPSPQPTDRIRDDELVVVEFMAVQLRVGVRPAGIARLLRAQVDSLRRMAEAEAEWFRTEISEPILARGGTMNEIATLGTSSGLDEGVDRAVLALYHSQQAQTWTGNIIGGFEAALRAAGLHDEPERLPAICFLDITGYTRLTQERGDHAAAELAERLARLVKRASIDHGGRPVKWLGDGVMCYFPDSGAGVMAALEMVGGTSAATLPPAHVGIHAGPVVMQEGDYYGQTVNLAARIADYARPGEVLVSSAVVAALNGATLPGVAFDDIGSVELKGVTGTVQLAAARRSVPAT